MYTLRYGILPADSFSDRAIVFNPEFGDHRIGQWGSKPVSPSKDKKNRLYPFYEELEQSIRNDGIKNPIFAYSLPEGTFCKYGCSRLYIAKKLNIELPAIICDYAGRWEHLEELKSKDDVEEKYSPLPSTIIVREDFALVDECLR